MSQMNMTPEDAYNVLVAEVHAPVFFNKLASAYGIVPQTAEEQRELLLMAGQLRAVHEQRQEKAAASRASYVANARQKLASDLRAEGYDVGTAPEAVEHEAQVKAAAADAVKHEVIKQAALVFGNYMADRAAK